jgi:hypothetical protein
MDLSTTSPRIISDRYPCNPFVWIADFHYIQILKKNVGRFSTAGCPVSFARRPLSAFDIRSIPQLRCDRGIRWDVFTVDGENGSVVQIGLNGRKVQ